MKKLIFAMAIIALLSACAVTPQGEWKRSNLYLSMPTEKDGEILWKYYPTEYQEGTYLIRAAIKDEKQK
jgi:hypothetical protein